MVPDDARILRLYIHGNARAHGVPLYRAVVEAARAAGMAGASVFPTELTFGVNRHVHDARDEYRFVDVPVVVEVVDAPERVDTLLRQLGPMLGGVFITVEPARVVRADGAA